VSTTLSITSAFAFHVQVAERNGLWKKEQGLLNFMKTYSPLRAHPPYATRRLALLFVTGIVMTMTMII
jgi:hypothetical protein